MKGIFGNLAKTRPMPAGKVRLVLQNEANECGIACLVMLANGLGVGADLQWVRKELKPPLRGASLRQLQGIAADMGVKLTVFKFDKDRHRLSLPVPCMIHCQDGHFFVLKKCRSGRVTVLDPAIGELHMTHEELRERATGYIALASLEGPRREIRKSAGSSFLRTLLGTLKTRRIAYLGILFISLLCQLFLFIIPYYSQYVIDHAKESFASTTLIVAVGILTAVFLLRAALYYVRSILITYLSQSVLHDWAALVYRRLVHLPLKFFEQRYVGDIVSRIGLLHQIQAVFSATLISALVDILVVMTLVGAMFWVSPLMGAVALASVLLAGAARIGLTRSIDRARTELVTHNAKQNTETIETVEGIQAVKAFGLEESFALALSRRMDTSLTASTVFQRLIASHEAGTDFILLSSKVCLLAYGMVLLNHGILTSGTLVALIAYYESMTQSAASIFTGIIDIRGSRVYLERLADITDNDVEQAGDAARPQGAHATVPGERIESIELRDVGFRYSNYDDWVFRNINLRVARGDRMAIVAPSGKGKTTLLKLISGLLEPTEGAIFVNGVKLIEYGVPAYRAQIGAAMQSDRLFSRSILANIAMSEQPESDRVVAACEATGIREDIEKMPLKYQTLLNDMGGALSGGQAQRVLLARAIYRKPSVLIMDEATSNLDTVIEEKVFRNIFSESSIVIYVTHRPDAVSLADTVYSLEGYRRHVRQTENRLQQAS